MVKPLQKGQKLVVASHNQGKVREINALIVPYGMQALSAGELSLPEPVEDGDSFAANAIIKAQAAANATGLPALSDDSGLEVHALGGAPGIVSARWAKTEGKPGDDFNLAMARVNDELEAKGAHLPERRTANFTCALALAFPEQEPSFCEAQVFEGQVFGHLVWPPRGDQGFGYDPIFVAKGEAITFGEMDPDKKHNMSHRAHAFALFKAKILD